MSEMLRVAIVPARGGSKRIPRKNVRPFLGVPLIVRTLTTLVESALFDHVVVSTDDDEIAEISEHAGAWVPFRRSAELADDFTPTVPVIVDAINQIQDLRQSCVGEVLVAYPAAVFMTVEDLESSLSMHRKSGFDVTMSATTYPAPILRSWRMLPDGSAEMIWPEHRNTRSQDLEPAYHDAGQFYWWAPGIWKRLAAGDSARYGMYVMPRWRVQDIDDEEDWIAAEKAWASFNVARDDSGL
jgi:pseudaminic acid cytidylyltransferase